MAQGTGGTEETRLRIEWLEAQVARLLAIPIVPAGAATVVWRPGGVTSGNVFATWAEVVAKVATMQGAVDIALDTDLNVGQASIPAGNWDLRPAGVSGPVRLVNGSKLNLDPAIVFPLITIANAAVTIHGLSEIENIAVDNQSTANVITVASGEALQFKLAGVAEIFHNVLAAGAAFLAVAGGGFCHLLITDFATISTLDTGTDAVQLANAAGANLDIVITDAGALDTNQLSKGAAGTCVCVVTSTQTLPPFPVYGSQANAPTVVPVGMRSRGTGTITGTGKTVAINTDADGNRLFLQATSIIVASQKTAIADGGASPTVRYAALSGDRTLANPGSFLISALTNVGGGDVNVNDRSVVDWEVIT